MDKWTGLLIMQQSYYFYVSVSGKEGTAFQNILILDKLYLLRLAVSHKKL